MLIKGLITQYRSFLTDLTHQVFTLRELLFVTISIRSPANNAGGGGSGTDTYARVHANALLFMQILLSFISSLP